MNQKKALGGWQMGEIGKYKLKQKCYRLLILVFGKF